MQAYRYHPTKQPGVVFVVVLHIAVIYALMTGLAKSVVERVRPPMEAVTVMDIKPPEPERKPPQPVQMKTAPQVSVPLPEVVIDTPPTPTITVPMTAATDTNPTPLQITTPTDATSTAPVRREFKPAYRVEPSYPRQAQKDGMNGAVVVRLHVAPAGNVTRVEIVSSSNRLFDREAVRALSQWKFNPEPVGFIAEYEIEFRLKD